MNKKINPKKILKKMSGLPADEQFLKSLREELADYMKNTPPLIKIKNPEKLFGARSFNFKMPAVFGLIAILLSGGTTVFASQKSLPGETLYPIKLLVEDVRLAAILNPEAKIESRIALAQKRIEEIQTVISVVQPEQATEKQTLALESALDNFNSQLETILSDAKKFKNKGSVDKAYEVAAGLEISMDNYRKLVKEPKNERKVKIKYEEDVISSIDNFEGKMKIEFDDDDLMEQKRIIKMKFYKNDDSNDEENDENHNEDDFNDDSDDNEHVDDEDEKENEGEDEIDEEDIQANILKTIDSYKNNGKNKDGKDNDEDD
ncbi:MAG: DUF5667 domain-containing protein [Patescibacteria group bacterium]